MAANNSTSRLMSVETIQQHIITAEAECTKAVASLKKKLDPLGDYDIDIKLKPIDLSQATMEEVMEEVGTLEVKILIRKIYHTQ